MTDLSSIVFQFNISSASSVAALSGRPAAQRDAHRRVRLVVGPVLHRRPLARPGWEGGGKIRIFREICANVWRACYRMYQNELLQEHMRLRAFFKLYKIAYICTAAILTF